MGIVVGIVIVIVANKITWHERQGPNYYVSKQTFTALVFLVAILTVNVHTYY